MPFLPNNAYAVAINRTKMKENVDVLYPELKRRGWSDQAIAAALGNWESECTISCNRPQKKTSFPNGTGGFGLAQWTNYQNKIGWYCRNVIHIGEGTQTATNPWSDYKVQLDYHEWECVNGLQGNPSKRTWYAYHGYDYTWSDWKVSTDSPSELAIAYYWQYERSAAADPGSRPDNAEYWYDYIGTLSGEPDPPPVIPPENPDDPPFTPTNKKKMSFLIKAYCVGTLDNFKIVQYKIDGL